MQPIAHVKRCINVFERFLHRESIDQFGGLRRKPFPVKRENTMENTSLASLAAQMDELESETFEIQDYTGTNEELLGGSTSSSSCSSSSSS